MKTLDKLSLVTKVLKELGCDPECVTVSNAPDDRLLIQVQYKNAHKIDKSAFNRLMNDKNAELHVPTIGLTDKGKVRVKNQFSIFY